MACSSKPEWTWQTPAPLALLNGFWLLAACSDYVLDFEIHEDMGYDQVTRKPFFRDSEGFMNYKEYPTRGSYAGGGFLRWDGCLQFSESVHVDLPADASDFLDRQILVSVLVELAKEHMEKWNP